MLSYFKSLKSFAHKFVLVLLAYGLFFTFSPLICTVLSINMLFPKNVEFPIQTINGIAINSKNRVFLALSNYGRIQVYNENGTFIFALPVDSRSYAYYFKIDEEDNIWIHTAWNNSTIMYDSKGNALNSFNAKSESLEEFNDIQNPYWRCSLNNDNSVFSGYICKDKKNTTIVRAEYNVKHLVFRVEYSNGNKFLKKAPFYYYFFHKYLLSIFIIIGIAYYILFFRKRLIARD